MIKKYTKKVDTHWQSYKDFFQITIFRYLITWFAIIPFLAKLFSELPKSITIQTAPEITYILPILLPFQWQLLWLSSLLFVFAFFLYKKFCPKFIITYPNFNKYLEMNHSPRWLIEEAKEVVKSKSDIPKFIRRLEGKGYLKEIDFNASLKTKTEVFEKQTKLFFNYEKKTYLLALPILTNHSIVSMELTNIAEKEIFWEIYGRFSSSKYQIRFLIEVLLVLSLIFFLIVLGEHIYAGLQYFIDWISTL